MFADSGPSASKLQKFFSMTRTILETNYNLFSKSETFFFLQVTKATEGKHERVPKNIHDAAETFAKEALEEDSDSDADDMS